MPTKINKFEPTPVPFTRAELKRYGGFIMMTLRLGDDVVTIPVPFKEFKGMTGKLDGTGSLGWYVNEKVMLPMGPTDEKKEVLVQFQLIGTVVNSKTLRDIPKEKENSRPPKSE